MKITIDQLNPPRILETNTYFYTPYGLEDAMLNSVENWMNDINMLIFCNEFKVDSSSDITMYRGNETIAYFSYSESRRHVYKKQNLKPLISEIQKLTNKYEDRVKKYGVIAGIATGVRNINEDKINNFLDIIKKTYNLNDDDIRSCYMKYIKILCELFDYGIDLQDILNFTYTNLDYFFNWQKIKSMINSGKFTVDDIVLCGKHNISLKVLSWIHENQQLNINFQNFCKFYDIVMCYHIRFPNLETKIKSFKMFEDADCINLLREYMNYHYHNAGFFDLQKIFLPKVKNMKKWKLLGEVSGKIHNNNELKTEIFKIFHPKFFLDEETESVNKKIQDLLATFDSVNKLFKKNIAKSDNFTKKIKL